MKTMLFSPGRMKDARLARGWSQSQLARSMNTREQNVTRWERGQNVPNANVVAAMAQALGRDIEFFYIESDPDAEDEKAALRRRAREMIGDFEPDLQDAVMAELYALRGSSR